ncbi:MAG: Lrp/AsnC family transcriptional regulator [Oligoflexales bacterium]
MMAIDSLDHKILIALQKDASLSYQEIAERLRTSTATVHNRIKRLSKEGVLSLPKANVAVEKLGYNLFAFIGVSLKEASKMDLVSRKLLAIPEILEIYFTTGEFSLMCKLVARETSELYDILVKKIQNIGDIQSTYTYVVLESLLQRDLSLDKVQIEIKE